MIGMKNKQAKPNWWLAGNVYQKILVEPSSTTEFLAQVDGFREKVRLNTLHLFRLPNWQAQPYLIEIDFPKWHQQMKVELWEYSGDEELDGDTARVIRIERKVDDIFNYSI